MELIKAVWNSFCSALIRFFNNRFIVNDRESYYRIELDKLQQRNEFLEDKLLDLLAPKKIAEIVDDSNTALEPVMQPIESMFQKRQRLEKESMLKWQADVKEARERIASERKHQSTEQLEKAVGV